jgi:predicted unusual protein kinase regulating ubiquinone biosynthesis (AarF/ABC1/UbiB family)
VADKDDDIVISKLSERPLEALGYLAPPHAETDDARETEPATGWTTAQVVREQERLAAELARNRSDLGDKAAQDGLLRLLGEEAEVSSPSARLRTVLRAIAVLSLDTETGTLPRAQRNRLEELVEGILKVAGVQPETSKLAFLHGDLHNARALDAARRGALVTAAMEQQRGHFASKRRPSGGLGYQALAAALRVLRLGHAETALDGFLAAETHALAPALRLRSQVQRVVAMRLMGELGNARALAQELLRSPDVPAEARLELDWEILLATASETGDARPVIAAVDRAKPHYTATYLLEAHLWSRAWATAADVKRLARLSTVRKLPGSATGRGGVHAPSFEIVARLDAAYDRDVPLAHKLHGLQEALEQLPLLRTVDRELLVWLAVARWAQRHHQSVLAAIALGEYQAWSRRLTSGRSPDALRAAADLAVDPWSRHRSAQTVVPAAASGGAAGVETTKRGRTLAIAKLTGRIATATIKNELKALGAGSRAAEVRARGRSEVGALIARHLGSLKGPLMKVGQCVSYLPSEVPGEIRAALVELQCRVPQLDGAAVRAIVEAELGRPVSAAFGSWNDAAIGGGSIGQVHSATLPDGREVAVKVRYPGIRQAIESDMRIARLMAPLIKPFVPRMAFRELVDEFGRMVRGECDYRLEAQMQSEFGRIVRDDPVLTIPRIYPDLTTEQVLTMDLVRGRTAREFAATATQEERDKAGIAIFSGIYRALLRDGLFNADPHPGNFIFMEDGRIAWLDFGFGRRYPPRTLSQIKPMLRAVVRDDRDAFVDGLLKLGWFSEGGGVDLDYQFRVARDVTFVAIAQDRVWRFDEAQVKADVEAQLTRNPNLREMRFPVQLTAFDRLAWVLHSLLATLRAEANWHRIVAPLLDEPDASDPPAPGFPAAG